MEKTLKCAYEINILVSKNLNDRGGGAKEGDGRVSEKISKILAYLDFGFFGVKVWISDMQIHTFYKLFLYFKYKNFKVSP